MKLNKNVLALTASAALLLQTPSAFAADLTVSVNGGIWQESYQRCIADAFEKETGKTADLVLGSPAQLLNQLAASPGQPPVDVLNIAANWGFSAAERGLVDKIDPEKLPHLDEIAPQFVEAAQGDGIFFGYGAMGLAFDKTRVETPPKTWDEFVEGTIRGDWVASMPSINYGSSAITSVWLFAHLYADDNLDDITPALEKIKEMKDSGNLIFWNNVNEFLSQIKSGDVDIGMYWDGRSWAFHDEGNPNIDYINPKPGAPIASNFIQKTKGSPDLAWKLIDISLQSGPQGCWGSDLQYAMSNVNVKYADQVAKRISPIDEILIPPYAEINNHSAQWTDQWNRMIGQ